MAHNSNVPSMAKPSLGFHRVSEANDPYLLGEVPTNSFPERHHLPEDLFLASAKPTPMMKHVTLRIMHSNGDWPPDGAENLTVVDANATRVIWKAIEAILQRSCSAKFGDVEVLQFDIKVAADRYLLRFTNADLHRRPVYEKLETLATHFINPLHKWVHFFAADTSLDGPISNTVLVIKYHEKEGDILATLWKVFDIGNDHMIYFTVDGRNVPLSWLTLPNNVDQSSEADRNVKLHEVEDGEIVEHKYCYSSANVTKPFEQLLFDLVVKGCKYKHDDEYRGRLQQSWRDLNADLCLLVPHQIFDLNGTTRELTPSYYLEVDSNGNSKPPMSSKTRPPHPRRPDETFDPRRSEDFVPFSLWNKEVKHLLCLLAQLTIGQRPVAIWVLYWCVHVRCMHNKDTNSQTREAQNVDLRMAIEYFQKVQQADEHGRAGLNKWRAATEEEKDAYTKAGEAAQAKLDAYYSPRETKELKQTLKQLQKKIAQFDKERKQILQRRDLEPPEEASRLSENEFFKRKEVEELEETKEELRKGEEENPGPLNDQEIHDFLTYEHFMWCDQVHSEMTQKKK